MNDNNKPNGYAIMSTEELKSRIRAEKVLFDGRVLNIGKAISLLEDRGADTSMYGGEFYKMAREAYASSNVS